MNTWIEDIVSALSNLGGTAHYSALYAEIERIRLAPMPKAWKKIIQRQIQDHADQSNGFKSKRLFYPVDGLGSGVWGLLSAPLAAVEIPQNEKLPSLVANANAPPGKQRNAPWSRDELILALDLYMRHRTTSLTKDNSEIEELSKFLNKLNTIFGEATSATFRNASGVYMKLMNFRRFDSTYATAGKVGLTRGNRDEELVWAEFSGDTTYLQRVAKAIRSALDNTSSKQLGAGDEIGIREAEEGRVLTRLHRYRERNQAIVEQRKKMALSKHGCLVCEACGFDFASVYGDIGQGMIEVHHTKPVHTLAEGEITKLEELALLCANCHRVVHSSRKWLSIEAVRAALLQQASAGKLI